MIKELIENQQLSSYDINLLFNHSDQYMVPHIQTQVKRCALVLYNTDKRENAEVEATTMADNLLLAGFDTKKEKWERAHLLPHTIHPLLDEVISKGLSLLVISIMSHGSVGMLRGCDDSKIPITDILELLKDTLPEHIPLVSAIHEHQDLHSLIFFYIGGWHLIYWPIPYL